MKTQDTDDMKHPKDTRLLRLGASGAKEFKGIEHCGVTDRDLQRLAKQGRCSEWDHEKLRENVGLNQELR
jgi:hypothetical protein